MNEEQMARAAALQAAIQYATMKFTALEATGMKVPAGYKESSGEAPLGSLSWIQHNERVFEGFIKSGRW